MVDPRSPLYAWEQIRDAVRARIDDGTYPDRLPAEVDLSAEFKSSRETVRKALKALVEEDLIVPIRGRGYFVKGRR